jgi:hypothetical protein
MTLTDEQIDKWFWSAQAAPAKPRSAHYIVARSKDTGKYASDHDRISLVARP